MSIKTFKNTWLLAYIVTLVVAYEICAHAKTAIFVVGMHRSGTSVTAGLLYYLDIYSGEKLVGISRKHSPPRSTPQLILKKTAKALPIYPKFEHRATYLLNDVILASLGTSWHDYSDFNIDWSKNLDDYCSCIKKSWTSDLLRHTVFFVKDPRIALLLPLYLKCAKYLGYTPKLIIVQRDLYEIAQSVHIRSNFLTLEQSYLLAQKYYTCIENYSTGYEILRINYADILTTLDTVVQQLLDFLVLPAITKKQKTIIHTFVKKELRHFTTTNDQEI